MRNVKLKVKKKEKLYLRFECRRDGNCLFKKNKELVNRKGLIWNAEVYYILFVTCEVSCLCRAQEEIKQL